MTISILRERRNRWESWSRSSHRENSISRSSTWATSTSMSRARLASPNSTSSDCGRSASISTTTTRLWSSTCGSKRDSV